MNFNNEADEEDRSSSRLAKTPQRLVVPGPGVDERRFDPAPPRLRASGTRRDSNRAALPGEKLERLVELSE